MRRMMRVMIGVFCMSAFLFGCKNESASNMENTKEETTVDNKTDVRDLEDDGKISDGNTISLTNIEYETIYKYSENRAWVTFKNGDNGQTQYGCIDEKGKMLFCLDDINAYAASVTPFSNGYAFIDAGDTVYLIDSNGIVSATYLQEENKKVKVYADGMVWVEEYNSDFDTAQYTYNLYDSNGNNITCFEIEGTEPITELYYYGKNVWGYDTYDNDGNRIQKFYCGNSNKWLDSLDAADNHKIKFYEDTAVIGISNEDPDDTGYRAKMILMDINGNMSEVGMSGDLVWNLDDNNVINEGYCILEEYKDYLISYDMATGDFIKFDNKYAGMLNVESLPDELKFEDGKVALPLIGQDENTYVALFDTSWNIIGEPVLCGKYDYTDGKLIVVSEEQSGTSGGSRRVFTVYDSNMNQLFFSKDHGYVAITSYDKGVACALPDNADSLTITAAGMEGNIMTDDNAAKGGMVLSEEWRCIDEQGNPIWEDIDTNSVQDIKL